MLQDKIQSFMEETLRENTLKTQAKMFLIFNWHKSDEMNVFAEYMNRSCFTNDPMVEAKWGVG